jgi:hypothetical protein
MWLNLAASSLSGEQGKKASTSRDNVASRMTPSQIELGQDIARKCQAANFKQCDALELERNALLKAQAAAQQAAAQQAAAQQAATQQAAAQQASQRDDRLFLGLAGAVLNGINNAEAAQKARLGVSTSCNTVGTHTSCTSN